MGRWLFLPDTVQEDIEVLARASVERLGKLRALLDSERTVRAFEVYLRVGEILGISDQQAAGLFAFWDYVQRERVENEKTGSDAFAEVVTFLEGKAASRTSPEDKESLGQTLREIKQKKAALTALLGECPKRELARKSAMLGSGPLPHFANVKTFCDIRPVYNKSGTEIVDQVALITLRLGTHSDRLEDFKEILINLRERDVDRIEGELKRLRKKLAVLKKLPPIKPIPAKKP